MSAVVMTSGGLEVDSSPSLCQPQMPPLAGCCLNIVLEPEPDS